MLLWLLFLDLELPGPWKTCWLLINRMKQSLPFCTRPFTNIKEVAHYFPSSMVSLYYCFHHRGLSALGPQRALAPCTIYSAVAAPAAISTKSCSLVPRVDDIFLTSPLHDRKAFSFFSPAFDSALKSVPFGWWDLIWVGCVPFQTINTVRSLSVIYFFISVCPNSKHSS